MFRLGHHALAFAGAMLAASPAIAQSPDGYYKGKTVTINIAGTAGGGIDIGARILARITRRSWETLGLREGMDVWAQVKGVSLAHK